MAATRPGLQQRIKRIGLFAGPLFALLLYFTLPHEYRAADGTNVVFGHAGRATLAAMGWMATWWMTEAVEIEVTSLLPIALFPLAGIMPLGKTTANYGADVIYLFLGGFVIALAIARCGLDRRIAFFTLRLVGTRPKAIVAGTMGATAFLSMWVSNTATAAMMVPIVLSVIDVALRSRTGKGLSEHGGIPDDDRDMRNFALSALLGVAYAASIGGLGTIIGSPPNGILVRFVEQMSGIQVTFLDWMMIGVPAMLTFLPLAWLLNTFVLFPTRMKEIEGGRDYVREQWSKLGPLSRGERATLAVFAMAVVLWMTAPLLKDWEIGGSPPAGRTVRCRRCDHRCDHPLPDLGRSRKGRVADGLVHRRPVAVGRAGPVRRRAWRSRRPPRRTACPASSAALRRASPAGRSGRSCSRSSRSWCSCPS